MQDLLSHQKFASTSSHSALTTGASSALGLFQIMQTIKLSDFPIFIVKVMVVVGAQALAMSAPGLYEIPKYYQSTSKAHANVLQNLIVLVPGPG